MKTRMFPKETGFADALFPHDKPTENKVKWDSLTFSHEHPGRPSYLSKDSRHRFALDPCWDYTAPEGWSKRYWVLSDFYPNGKKVKKPREYRFSTFLIAKRAANCLLSA